MVVVVVNERVGVQYGKGNAKLMPLALSVLAVIVA